MATEVITLIDTENNNTAYPYTVDSAVKRTSVSGLSTTAKETLDSLENRTSQAVTDIDALESDLAAEERAREAADATKVDKSDVQDISAVTESMVSTTNPISAHAMGLMKQYVDAQVAQTIITPASGSIVPDNATIESNETSTNVYAFSVKDNVFGSKHDVDELKEVISGTSYVTPTKTVTKRFMSTTGAPYTGEEGTFTIKYSSSYTSNGMVVFPVVAGTKYTIHIPLTRGTNNRLAAYFNGNLSSLDAESDAQYTGFVLEDTGNSDEKTIVINSAKNYSYLLVGYDVGDSTPTMLAESSGLVNKVNSLTNRVSNVEDDMEDLDSAVDDLEDTVQNELIGGMNSVSPIKTLSKRIISVSQAPSGAGTFKVTYNSSFTTSRIEIYEVSKGDKYTISIPVTTSSNTRVVAYYNGLSTALDADEDVNLTGYVIDEKGNSGQKTIVINEAANYDYLLVAYNTGGAAPTTTLTKEGMRTKISEIDGRVSALEGGQGGSSANQIGKIINHPINLLKPSLSVLIFGNSFTAGSTTFLDNTEKSNDFVRAASIDKTSSLYTNFCIYRYVRSSGSFDNLVDAWHDIDTSTHNFGKVAGGMTMDVSGSHGSYESGGNTYYYGADLRNCLMNNQWDVIILQQNNARCHDYSVWEANGLKEWMRILKAYQPQAAIGFNMVHASYGSSVSGDTESRWGLITTATKRFMSDYGIDFIIPYGTAVENIRKSSVTSGADYALCRDEMHLATGIGQYVANGCIFQSIIAPRFGKTIMGNTYRYDVTDDVAGAGSSEHTSEYISVTNSNATACQMAVILATSDMWTVQNPDDISL